MFLIVIPEILRELFKQQAALSSIKLCNKFYSASRAYARPFKLAFPQACDIIFVSRESSVFPSLQNGGISLIYLPTVLCNKKYCFCRIV